jgi:hypothetical protein
MMAIDNASTTVATFVEMRVAFSKKRSLHPSVPLLETIFRSEVFLVR